MIQSAMSVRGAARRPSERYLALDGMRGVAAVIVVAFHAPPFIGGLQVPFGYLAVDLFFALSGFVLAKRYDVDFEQGMSPTRFLALRLRRLYPLYFAGFVLGMISLVLTKVIVGSKAIAASLVTGLVMLPSPTWRQSARLFPGNSPAWSLFFEICANAAWATAWSRLRGKMLLFAIAIFAMALLLAIHSAHTLDVGARWSVFPGGFARVGFSFLVGIALARLHSKRPPRLQLPSWLILLAVALSFATPVTGILARLYEVFCVAIIFPALLYWGAEAIDSKSRVGPALGDASFAIYAVHRPLLELLSLINVPHGAALQLAFVAAMVPIGLALATLDLRLQKRLRTVFPQRPPATNRR